MPHCLEKLLFVVDADLSPKYCGFAQNPGSLALITPSSLGCWRKSYGDYEISSYVSRIYQINTMSMAIIHELLHNLGVRHTCVDRTDIMMGGCTDSRDTQSAFTIDVTNTRNVGGSLSGANILDFKGWTDGSGKMDPP